jgi:hypothetical protein
MQSIVAALEQRIPVVILSVLLSIARLFWHRRAPLSASHPHDTVAETT